MFPRLNIFNKSKRLLAVLSVIFLIDYFGVLTHLFELDFNRLFIYPLEGDVVQYAHRIRYNQQVDVRPINIYNYTFLNKCEHKCVEEGTSPVKPIITFIIKSAMPHFERRMAIRQTWGFEQRFSDVIIRTVFMLGISSNQELQKHITIESNQYKDIVQSSFYDTYYNNTIKTMMGFKWAVETCPTSKYYLFVDDDFYISPKNVLRFVANPQNYPRNLEEADETLRKLGRRLNRRGHLSSFAQAIAPARAILAHDHNFYEDKDFMEGKLNLRNKKYYENKVANNIHREDVLFAGFVFHTSPHRHKSSKWYVSLKEYPFHLWPPYITAGAFILSREALFELYFASMYVKHFRFDDIYLGLVAYKAKMNLHHCEEFYFHKHTYSGPYSYRYVVATHGFEDPNELIKTWNECRSAGHA